MKRLMILAALAAAALTSSSPGFANVTTNAQATTPNTNFTIAKTDDLRPTPAKTDWDYTLKTMNDERFGIAAKASGDEAYVIKIDTALAKKIGNDERFGIAKVGDLNSGIHSQAAPPANGYTEADMTRQALSASAAGSNQT